MRTAAMACAVLLVTAAAHAQTTDNRFYAAPTTSVDFGTRGNIPGGAVPAAGLLVGARVGGGWSVEAEIERAFRTTSRTYESVFVSYPPVSSPTREDFERYGVRGRFVRTTAAGSGWSAQAVWRSREPGRVNVGFLMGVSARTYKSAVARTTTFVSPEITLAPTNSNLLPYNESRTMTAGGLTGGIVLFTRVTEALTVAPEIRLTRGLITDDPFTVFRTGIRAMWAF